MFWTQISQSLFFFKIQGFGVIHGECVPKKLILNEKEWIFRLEIEKFSWFRIEKNTKIGAENGNFSKRK